MDPLVEYVRACQSAQSLRVRRRFAGEVIGIVRPSLYVFIAQGCDPDQVEDVLQDTLVVIATKLDTLRCDVNEQVWGWCYAIARNKLKQLHEKARRQPTESLELEEIRRVVDALAAEDPPPTGERLDLEEALQLLEFGQPPCRQLLWWHYVLGLDYQELADLLDLSYDAVRMKIKRCLERAQELFGKEGARRHA